MSEDEAPNRDQLNALPGQGVYPAGYRKPPEENQFKPGKSGNPRGRPKGAKNKRPALNAERLKDIILDEAYREITVRDGDRSITVPMAQAIVRALAVNAAKGQHRAQRLFAEMLTTTERQNKALADAWLDTAMTYKIEWDRELERRKRHGITDLADPLPHPDHIQIDMNTGEPRFTGPATKEEKAEFDLWAGRRQEFEEELEQLQVDLKANTDPKIEAVITQEIEQTEKVLGIIRQLLPGV
jgi:hypothetical protein